ncbi:hypothetical protein GCM10012286_21750 [Streptomyces lasiicapitis]|uniref:Uncharacterized protein n=1 Tax=Streptomyces lasiicapitis TaxID=1923961 RepID=A0ABQ2LPZ5_9ACTN|nr:hypothetical protein GCM10012286_21750 [Streptomyces lasiicapitis]
MGSRFSYVASLVGAPVLHRQCAEVTEFGQEPARHIDDMFVTMHVTQGVGACMQGLPGNGTAIAWPIRRARR